MVPDVYKSPTPRCYQIIQDYMFCYPTIVDDKYIVLRTYRTMYEVRSMHVDSPL